MQKKTITIVVSVYNEEDMLSLFLKELKKDLQKIDCNYEIIFVNDGSIDNSRNILNTIEKDEEAVKVINFSRNFGHEAAMIAGIDYSIGDMVICMDSDLQHPPELIKDMVEEYEKGFDIINMVSIKREDAGFVKKITSKLFYKFLNKISKIEIEPNASDFFLISKKVVNILKTDYRERNRFIRGIIQMIGFKKTTISFKVPARAKGKSKYSLFKLMILSASAIASSSQLPLKISLMVGVLFGILSIIVSVYSVIMKFMGNPFSGYTTIIVLISISFSILFFVLGIIGEYLGYLFVEIKKRPIYIIDKSEEE
ncbi:MAG: glycosyltransferase family 2 protein [Bacteroidales bacterium]|nr:glycosyltransferase family 2 protein [Bacteroidales bacterium]